ncbi:MAG: glycosyltransferase [Anaerolineaceae bacterium]
MREIDQLGSLFSEVRHLAPLHTSSPPGSALPYRSRNMSFVGVKPAGGEKLQDKLSIIRHIPNWMAAMRVEMRQADAIHIRCPAGISLIALLVCRLWARDKPVWVKYAGNWQPPAREELSYKFRRWLLRRKCFRYMVTVNGRWPDQPGHVISFINPSFSLEDYEISYEIAQEKSLKEPIQILFVGRLETEKGVYHLINIARKLKRKGIFFSVYLIGDGKERKYFENLVNQFDLQDVLVFTGWISRYDVKKYYEQAHFILHPSIASEGWPKVLSEAMAYGVVPLASTVSCIPQILGKTRSGLALPAKDTDAYVEVILDYTQYPWAWKQVSKNAIMAAREFTYEKYLSDVSNMFSQSWQIDLEHEQP